ncbi:MAG: YoaK family protein [Thermoplasmata archaeon]
MGGVGQGTRESAPPPPSLDPAERRRDALLIGLTFAAGAVDAVSYLGLGQIFTANMTGNVVFLALAVGEGNLSTALRSVAALVAFSLGALSAGRLLPRPRPPGPWPRPATMLLWAELACMFAFAVLWATVGGWPVAAFLFVLIALSSFGMGIQNAAARYLAVPGLTTTVVTGALTGFMVDLPALGISGPAQRRAGWAVVALFLGAAAGAFLLVYARPFAPLITVIVVALVGVIAYRSFDRSATAKA